MLSLSHDKGLSAVFERSHRRLCPYSGDLGRHCCGSTRDLRTVFDKFSDCFEGPGCFEREHTIRVNPAVKPVISRARHIPISGKG